MSTESDDPRTHTSARMMKLATGVALTSCITGASRVSARGESSAAAASRVPAAEPSPKPSRMRPELKPTRRQNAACGSSSSRVRSACTGDTRNTSCPMAMAAHCHTASQNTTAPARRKNCFEPVPVIEPLLTSLQKNTILQTEKVLPAMVSSPQLDSQ